MVGIKTSNAFITYLFRFKPYNIGIRVDNSVNLISIALLKVDSNLQRRSLCFVQTPLFIMKSVIFKCDCMQSGSEKHIYKQTDNIFAISLLGYHVHRYICNMKNYIYGNCMLMKSLLENVFKENFWKIFDWWLTTMPIMYI